MYRTLSNGVRMPSVILGTYPLQNAAMEVAVDAALGCGYRGFDTAHLYQNEDSLGRALDKLMPKHGLKREDIFITTKVSDDAVAGVPNARLFRASYPGEKKDIRQIVNAQVDESLAKLKSESIDLLLIHWPIADYFCEIWSVFGELVAGGKVRAIGVSNCFEWHIKKLLEAGGPMPMVNQLERHPLNTQMGMVHLCEKLNIQFETYSPLRFGGHSRENLPPTLLSLADRHNKSVAQIILRWNLQQGTIPIPKSGNPQRIRENIAIFDFALSADEMTQIDLLNENYAFLPGETYCPGWNDFKTMKTPPAL